jgi:glutamate/tyrosine decarboxylase-like PLP-dependent enzyme
VIDPISELAALAAEKGLGFHVDACLGGFLLPWAKRLGYSVPDFDFRLPGVTSISADVHKYGFAAKGASTILYRDKALRRYQFFVYADWPGGLYASPTMTGTRPGGSIAAAWAAMMSLGESGYMRLTENILKTADKLRAGISAVPGIKLVGKPELSVFAFTSDAVDIYAVGDAMDARGWALDRQQKPACLHMMVTPVHAPIADRFLTDLRESVAEVAAAPAAPRPTAAVYGMLGALPDRAKVKDALLDMMDGVFPSFKA